MKELILNFGQIGMHDISRVGGKNASLGEMYCCLVLKGIAVPNGFATTTQAWWTFIDANNLREPLGSLFEELDLHKFSNLTDTISTLGTTISPVKTWASCFLALGTF